LLLFTAGLVIASSVALIGVVSHLLGPLPALSTRLTLFYQHPNFLAPYFASISLIALALAWYHKRLLIRFLCILLALSSMGALWITDSRAGFLGFGAGLCLFLCLRMPWNRIMPSFLLRHKKTVFGAGLLLLLAAVVTITLFSNEILDAARQSTRLKRAQDYRLDAWSNSVEIIKQNAWTGIGLNTFMSVKKYAPGSKFAHESTAPHPHNLLLYIAQSCGLPALFFFIMLLGGYVWGMWILLRRAESLQTKKLAIGCASASVALLCSGLLDLGLSLVTLFPGIIWLFMAIVASLCRSRLPSRSHGISLNNLYGVVGLVLIVFAMANTFVLPVAGRILLKRCALSLARDDEAETQRLGKLSLAADPYLEQTRAILLRQYLKDERLEEAFRLVHDAVTLQPENAALFMKLGDVLSNSEQHEGAAEQFRKAVEMDHGSSNLPLYYARLINENAILGRRAEAATDLEAAIRHNIAVINLVDWEVRPHQQGRDDQFLSFGEGREILRLEETLDTIYTKMKEEAGRGVMQDRFDWFALFQAYHHAFIYNQALAVLDDVEAVFGEKEKAVTDCLRAEIAEELGDKEKSRALISQADALGDASNPAAVLYYQSRKSELSYEMDETRLDEEIAMQRKTLAGLRDYVSSQKSFRTVLDNLLFALEIKGDFHSQITPMQSRLFFCSDKQERVTLLLRQATLLKSTGCLEEAELTISHALDLLADQNKRMAELDDQDRRNGMQKGACLLAGAYQEIGLAQTERLERIERITDFFSANPARLLFKYHFLIQSGMAEEANLVLDLALIDNAKRLFLWEHKARVCHLLDDVEGLHEAYREIRNIYVGREIDLEERCTGLFAAIFENRKNVELILEVALNKSYIYKLDQSINILTEALKLLPEEPDLHMLAARIYRMNNRPEKALEALEAALALDPNDPLTLAAHRHLLAHLLHDNERNNTQGGGQ